jgi:hypothetical protein
MARPPISWSAPTQMSVGRTDPETTLQASTSNPVAAQATITSGDRSRTRITAASSSRSARSTKAARFARSSATGNHMPRSAAGLIASSVAGIPVGPARAAAAVAL